MIRFFSHKYLGKKTGGKRKKIGKTNHWHHVPPHLRNRLDDRESGVMKPRRSFVGPLTAVRS